MKYLSVCSGIEAATVAWHPLGWTPAAFAEIEKFPATVLAHHYPDVPNFGDMTKFKEWPDVRPDILVGGTPCQSFSVAGLRKGMADPRGNLALTYLAIADQYRPEWLLWENVPGVLSSNGGKDFGAILGGMVELGYGVSYRVLDAQYVRVDGFGRAVPQRRRRVFVVGNSRDWRRAAAVLFERESLSGNFAPSRRSGERVAPTISARPSGGGGLGTDFDLDGGLIAATVAPTLNAHFGDKQGLEDQHINGGCGLFVAFSCKDSGGDASAEVSPTLRAGGFTNSHANAGVMPAIAFQSSQSGVRLDEVHATLDSNNGSRRHNGVIADWAVRRLTPTECERLQGFPDGYTNVPWRGKNGSPDGPRYKALGNSMAVNAMRWLGTRIQTVSGLAEAKLEAAE